MFKNERDAAIEAVRWATRAARRVAHGDVLDALSKADDSPVTVAELAVQALACSALNSVLPGIPMMAGEDASPLDVPVILGRVVDTLGTIGFSLDPGAVKDAIERGRSPDSAERFCALDPIDGTKGFLRCEQYAISLVLVVDGEVQLGVLGTPNLSRDLGVDGGGSVQWAVRGQGAFRGSIEGGSFEAISVFSTQAATRARVVESVESGYSSHRRASMVRQRLGVTEATARLDSQAKYAVVARGEAEIYLRPPTRAGYREQIWDHAGGVVVLEEAGGRVTDIEGRRLDFGRGELLVDNRGVFALNGHFHDEVLDAVGDLDLPT